MKVLFFLLFSVLVTAAGAATIKATALPQEASLIAGQTIHIPVNVDLSTLSEALGSYTASLTWDTHILQYVGYSAGTSDGFSSPVVNNQNVKMGKLIFASAHPSGVKGNVNILNVEFKLIGPVGSRFDLHLGFSAMAAAATFNDLLPFVETTGIMTQVGDKLSISALPTEFQLVQNFPNPFNPSTEIRLKVPHEELIQVTVYNAMGQKVLVLLNEKKSAGEYPLNWNGVDEKGNSVPAGLYIVQMQAGEFTDNIKALLVK